MNHANPISRTNHEQGPDTNDNERLVDQERDQPLLMGYGFGPDMMRKVGLDTVSDPRLSAAMGSILADAVIGHRDDRSTSFSLNRNFYIGLTHYHPSMTYSLVSKAVPVLAGQGLIEVEKGKRWPEGKGKQSRLWATSRLIDLAGDQPALVPWKGAPLILKDTDKTPIPFRSTERTDAWARDVQAQSEAIRSTKIRIEAEDIEWSEPGFVTVPGLTRANGEKRADIILRPDQIELRRVANNSSWRQGMRHYGHWCQSLPKARRKQITIDGTPVELLDFGAAHPSILYAQAGSVLDGDPYDVSGFERDEVKLALLILVNAGSRGQAIAAMAYRLAQVEPRPDTQPTIVHRRHQDRAREILNAVMERHQPIASSFCTRAGTGLQAIEADIIANVMKAARKRGIVTLPVHDELIARTGPEADHVQDLMIEKWGAVCGAFPLI